MENVSHLQSAEEMDERVVLPVAVMKVFVYVHLLGQKDSPLQTGRVLARSSRFPPVQIHLGSLCYLVSLHVAGEASW